MSKAPFLCLNGWIFTLPVHKNVWWKEERPLYNDFWTLRRHNTYDSLMEYSDGKEGIQKHCGVM